MISSEIVTDEEIKNLEEDTAIAEKAQSDQDAGASGADNSEQVV